MIKRDFMLMFLAHLPECMTWIYVRAVLHRVRSRKSRMLLKYIISDDFHLHLRKLMLSPLATMVLLSFRWRAGPSRCCMRMGRKLMNLALRERGDRCTPLNTAVVGQPLYESLDFEAIGTLFTSIRARWPLSSRLHCRREKASARPNRRHRKDHRGGKLQDAARLSQKKRPGRQEDHRHQACYRPADRQAFRMVCAGRNLAEGSGAQGACNGTCV
jgi:hypothetical protein